MNISSINREDADKIEVIIKNVDGSGSMTTGMGVALAAAGASVDGVSAVKSAGTGARGFIGVARSDIPVNGFGLVTAWGLANSVLLSHAGTSITITAGDTLKFGGVAGTFFSSLAAEAFSTQLYKYVIGADSITISGPAYVRGIVRAL